MSAGCATSQQHSGTFRSFYCALVVANRVFREPRVLRVITVACIPEPGVSNTLNQSLVSDLVSNAAAGVHPTVWPATHTTVFETLSLSSSGGSETQQAAQYTLAYVDLVSACLYQRPNGVQLTQRLAERVGAHLSMSACVSVVTNPRMLESIKAPYWRLLAVRIHVSSWIDDSFSVVYSMCVCLLLVVIDRCLYVLYCKLCVCLSLTVLSVCATSMPICTMRPCLHRVWL